MKTPSIFSILTATALVGIGSSSTFAQVATPPVGFQEVTLKGGAFNLVGVSFVTQSLTAGALEGATATTLTDSDANFTTSLAGQTNLVVEITGGVGATAGAWSQVSGFTATELTTDIDLTSYFAAGATYVVRAAPTIADLFGAANEAGLQTGSSTAADIIWLSKGDGSGGFDKYYYADAAPPFVTAGWKNVNTANTNQAATPVFTTDGLLIERRGGTDLALTFVGMVKTTPTVVPVYQGFNFLENTYPVGTTLGNSGLESSLQAGSSTTADIVWVPNGVGGYNKYYFAVATPPFITAGWKNLNTANADKSSDPITSGFIVERRGSSTNMTLTPPPGYSGL